MKTKQHISAFTLSEMIVVIILTSIVVGMAFAVLTMVHQHFDVIQKNLAKKTEFNQLEEVLWMDFHRYNNIRFKHQQLQFHHPLDSVTYTFNEDYILRKTDTFDISTSEVYLYFDGIEVTQSLIDAIKLITNKELQNQVIFVYKQNDATPFMNSWPLN